MKAPVGESTSEYRCIITRRLFRKMYGPELGRWLYDKLHPYVSYRRDFASNDPAVQIRLPLKNNGHVACTPTTIRLMVPNKKIYYRVNDFAYWEREESFEIGSPDFVQRLDAAIATLPTKEQLDVLPLSYLTSSFWLWIWIFLFVALFLLRLL